jgi:hypothetical protein
MNAFKPMGILSYFTALALLLGPVVTHAWDAETFNERGCAWPLLLSPEGPANVQGPDDAARYWIMPFDTTQYKTMTLYGAYPDLRYFAIAAYETIKDGPNDAFEVNEHLYDAEISPDAGINPFVQPGGGNGTYRIEISRDSQGMADPMTVSSSSSPNTMTVTSDLVWVVFRAYVSDADASLTGQSLMGGIDLPAITLTDYEGNSEDLADHRCTPINKWSDFSEFARFLFPPALDITVNEGTPDSDRLWFATPKNPPSILWPNPDGKYLMMLPGSQYQTGRVIVIHGKAPGFPDTFNGSPVWVPSKGFRRVDMRYWAVCNMNLVWPPSVVACATDLTTRLQGRYYTIVISDDRQRPDWLNPTVNWIPWGDGQYPKFLVLRNILSAPDFDHAAQDVWDARDESGEQDCTFEFSFSDIDRDYLDAVGPCAQEIMGDYYPVALWCDKATFRAGGFQACLKKGE